MNAEQLLNFAIKIERENALKSERTSTKIIQEFRSYWLKKEKIVIPFFQDFSCLYANLKEEKQKRKLLELANKHRTHYSPFIANSIQGTLRPIQDKNYYYDSSVYKEEPGILDIIENNGIYSFLTEFGNIEVLKASEYFKNSNLSHMLAVSGAHTSYVIMIVTFLMEKMKQNKRLSRYVTIIVLIIFCILTGATPSVERACIMAIYSIVATLCYKKADILVSLSLSILLLVLQNPYCILNVGLQLSFGGTIGIVIFSNLRRKKLEETQKWYKKIKNNIFFVK